MEMPTAENEHKWLQRLVGSWKFEGEFSMAPDQPAIKNIGTEVVEALGELWTIGHLSGQMPGGEISHSIMTLGYDTQQKRFVGTFVASMMTHLWIYEGALNHSANTLVLDCEGPSFAEEGKLARYQDIIEFVDQDHRIFRSQYMGPDGQWVPFMKSTYTRLDP